MSLSVKFFYSDSYSSWQKRKTLDFITQSELNQVFSHINSIKRKSLNGKSPYDSFRDLFHFPSEIFNITEMKATFIKLKK